MGRVAAGILTSKSLGVGCDRGCVLACVMLASDGARLTTGRKKPHLEGRFPLLRRAPGLVKSPTHKILTCPGVVTIGCHDQLQLLPFGPCHEK